MVDANFLCSCRNFLDGPSRDVSCNSNSSLFDLEFSFVGTGIAKIHKLSDQKLNLNGKGGYCDKVDERTEAKKCEYRITWTRFGSAKLEKKMSFKNNEGKITSNWVGQ